MELEEERSLIALGWKGHSSSSSSQHVWLVRRVCFDDLLDDPVWCLHNLVSTTP